MTNGATYAAGDAADSPTTLDFDNGQQGMSPVESLMAKLRGKYDDEGNKKPESEEPEERPATEAKTEPKEEPPAKDESEPKEDPKLELKLGKAQRHIRQLEADMLGLKKELADAKADGTNLRAKLKKNWVSVVEKELGKPFPELMQAVAKGELDVRDAAELPPEVMQRLTKAEEITKKWEEQEAKRIADEEAQKAETAKAEQRKKDKATAVKFLSIKEADYPFAAAVDMGPEDIVNKAYEAIEKGEEPDLDKIAAEVNADVRGFLLTVLNNERLSKLLVSDKELRQLGGKAFGGLNSEKKQSPTSDARARPKAADADGLPSQPLTQEVPTRADREWSRDEERNESVRLLRQFKRTGSL